MKLVELLVLFFAVFGTTFTLHYTDGPWDILFKIRAFLVGLDGDQEVTEDHLGNEVYIGEGFFTKLLTCFWCSSFWVALIVVGSYYLIYGYSIKSFPFVLMASVGVSGYLNESVASG